MRALSDIGTEKITFPPKPDRHTDIHTEGRTDISVYRVASLLKNYKAKHRVDTDSVRKETHISNDKLNLYP